MMLVIPQKVVWKEQTSKLVWVNRWIKDRSLSYGPYRIFQWVQAEVYAIKKCSDILRDRSMKGAKVYVMSASQSSLKALEGHSIESLLVLECHDSVQKFSARNRVKLICEPVHEGIAGNEVAEGDRNKMVNHLQESFPGVGQNKRNTNISSKTIKMYFRPREA